MNERTKLQRLIEGLKGGRSSALGPGQKPTPELVGWLAAVADLPADAMQHLRERLEGGVLDTAWPALPPGYSRGELARIVHVIQLAEDER